MGDSSSRRCRGRSQIDSDPFSAGTCCRSPFRATLLSHAARKPVLTQIPFSCHREPCAARCGDLMTGIATVAALLGNDNHFIQGLEIKLTPTLDPCMRRRAYFISKAAVTSMDGMNAVVTASATVAPPSLWMLLHGRRSPHLWAILRRVGSAPTISGIRVTSTPMPFPLSTVVGAHTCGRFFAAPLQGSESD